MQEYTTVRLPTESVAVLEERVQATEFESVAAYLTFLIEELSYQTEDDSVNGSADHGQQSSESESESEMDEEAIERRLRSLGYLDVDG